MGVVLTDRRTSNALTLLVLLFVLVTIWRGLQLAVAHHRNTHPTQTMEPIRPMPDSYSKLLDDLERDGIILQAAEAVSALEDIEEMSVPGIAKVLRPLFEAFGSIPR